MPRLRTWSALVFLVTLMPALWAEDKPASPWAVDRSLSVSPQGAPTPALKYRLLPLNADLKEGNAAPIYLRLVHEQSDASQKYWTETPKAWNGMPVDKIPLDEARPFLQRLHKILQQFEAGARRRTAEWNYTFDVGDPIGMLLPDVQVMRNYAPMLILQARVALAEKDFTAAAHHLETGFAFSRHVAEGPTLIHSLIAIALTSQFTDAVGDFVERPDAPNLYWALAALPTPLIGLRGGLDMEYHLLEMQFPELGDLDRERTAEQWDGVLRRVRIETERLSEGSKMTKETLGLKDRGPGDAATKSPDLAAARKFVARTRGLPVEQAEAMPAAQALLLYLAGAYHEVRDESYRGSYLPYPQALPLLDASTKRRVAKPNSEGEWVAGLLLPALSKVMSRQIALERNLAALRVVEAMRMYAAAHDGKLPEKLDDITEVPIPLDPATGKSFEYSRAQDTATLVGPNNASQADSRPVTNGVRYRVTIRKK